MNDGVYSAHGSVVRDHRGAEPPDHPEPPGLVGTVRRRDRAPAADASDLRVQAPPCAARGRLRGRRASKASDASIASGPSRSWRSTPGWRLSGASGRPTSMRSNAISIGWSEHPGKERRAMSNRDTYAPGPASGAEVRKEGDKWTLVLVRDLRHPPARVWQALTDPAHLREWAPFDADRTLDTRGAREAHDGRARPPRKSPRRNVTRAEAPRSPRVQLGRQRPPLGARAARRRHAPHALAQHRPWLHLDGRCGLAHLLRCAGSAARRSALRTNRRRRRPEVRRLAAIERRVRKAVRR